MQYEQFRKKLLIESAVAAAVIFVVSAVVYLLSAIRDDYIESNDAAQKKVNLIDLQTATLKKKFTNITENMEIYEEVKRKQAQGQLAINRQMVLEKFNQFKNQYALNNLRLSVSPVQDLKDPQYKRTTSEVNFSEVNLDLEVMNDESIYELLRTMQQELPGVSKIARLNMKRDTPLNQVVIDAIRQKGVFPLIKADIKFIWYGINQLEVPPAGGDASNPPN